MNEAEKLAILFSGVFFLNGLLTGIWKYSQIKKNESGHAHPYVDISHRASLLYAFASVLLAKFAEVSQLPDIVEALAVSLVVVYFATAIITYMVHGLLQDTENQLKPPYKIGKLKIAKQMISVYMGTLILAEIGGFLVLFYGVITALY